MSEQELEITIYTPDVTLAESILQPIKDVEIRRPRVARTIDPITIVTVVSSSIALVNGLLDLRDRLRKRSGAPRVVVRNARGDSVPLVDADKSDLEHLVEGKID
jgi:hypothetical protein